ncbi:MAG: hypothetical protein BA874_03730 [Desulfuromonadales bacterium C00003068]|jgi:hypothetical protein|nr:MAG: hypothetical protein BA874_03730 [Desulfuromonadales bacterium C00003068]
MIYFTKEFLKDELDLPFRAIHDEIMDSNRWSTQYEIVFEHEGKFYLTHYSVGATEQQDESPWEYEDRVGCTEVELKEVVVKQWVVKQ